MRARVYVRGDEHRRGRYREKEERGERTRFAARVPRSGVLKLVRVCVCVREVEVESEDRLWMRGEEEEVFFELASACCFDFSATGGMGSLLE